MYVMSYQIVYYHAELSCSATLLPEDFVGIRDIEKLSKMGVRAYQDCIGLRGTMRNFGERHSQAIVVKKVLGSLFQNKSRKRRRSSAKVNYFFTRRHG